MDDDEQSVRLDKYSGMDPEIALTGAPFNIGYDRSRVPRTLTTTLGMSVTF